jgi:uncharacterized membrane protein HdeD (DUF308 family)
MWILWYTMIAIGAYIIISGIVALWYCLSTTAKPNKWLEFICYPAGLLIMFYAWIRGVFRD